MSRNRLPLLIGLLVALLAVAYLSGTFEGDPSTISVPEVEIPVDRVDTIRMSGGIRLTMVRDESGWKLAEPVAAVGDSATIDQLLADLGALEFTSVVTASPERHAQYGVDSSGTHLEVSWDTGSSDLVISSRGPDYESNYVRFGNQPAVYASRARIALPTAVDRWRDKRMLPSDTPISGTVLRPDEDYTVLPGPGGWVLTIGDGSARAADSTAVARWLGRFSGLRADGFMEDAGADSVRSAADHGLSLGYSDGSTIRLYMLERDGAAAAVRGDGSDVYRLFSSRLGTLVPAASTLTND